MKGILEAAAGIKFTRAEWDEIKYCAPDVLARIFGRIRDTEHASVRRSVSYDWRETVDSGSVKR